jgi:hypothetical protein
MIKRLASAPKKKARKTPATLRSRNKKARRVAVPVASKRGGSEEASVLAAEQIFLMYDAAEARHAKT